ncbi:hypothetical protein CDO52_00640 [Nocardiopsis gilva YIM 90087]|uniref:Uncharacterized protein n=1 Tax=Nocardiopsis gilva YIM 90087 TaxID=1235441 RepID=A0A223S032_9ACTN|nr:hypothetical protein [Nocardiopsis gilva]ASU81486.1 hypothetical protein CDO52_00640 [Nocardiopsis gilva YIM 90087]
MEASEVLCCMMNTYAALRAMGLPPAESIDGAMIAVFEATQAVPDLSVALVSDSVALVSDSVVDEDGQDRDADGQS